MIPEKNVNRLSFLLKLKRKGAVYVLSGLLIWSVMFFFQIPTGDCSNAGQTRPFRLAISSGLFTEVNEMDVRATMKVWITTVAKDLDIPVDPDPNIQPTIDALVKFGLSNEVDGFAIITPEFLRLREHFSFDRFVTAIVKGVPTEEYLLLVNRNSGLKRLDQLKGLGINVLNNARMSLALYWLDTVLLEAHLGSVTDFIGTVHFDKNPSQVALPVFFQKSAACLVTKHSFEVMCELNPQLKKELLIIASSPPLVPSGFAIKKDGATRFEGKFVRAMESMGNTITGRQILDLIKGDALKDEPISILDSSLDLLAKHQRLRKINTVNVTSPENSSKTPIR